jgi:hypothetical protein
VLLQKHVHLTTYVSYELGNTIDKICNRVEPFQWDPLSGIPSIALHLSNGSRSGDNACGRMSVIQKSAVSNGAGLLQ